jgi:very-short-patch-repair endonuclease
MNQTPEEKLLWMNLRNRKFHGKKFLRQHPLIYGSYKNNPKFFIADFYCAESKLVIELDGKIHDFQREYDEQRDFIIQEMGLKVLRIRNEELLGVINVLKKIKSNL